MKYRTVCQLSWFRPKYHLCMKKVQTTEGIISWEVPRSVSSFIDMTYLIICLVWVMQEKNIVLTEHYFKCWQLYYTFPEI